VGIDLRGLPIVITGASSGIGLETARLCARAGMPVVLGARRLDRLEALAAEIHAAGGRAVAQACDVTVADECDSLIARCAGEFGSPHAVFANAGYGFEGAAHAVGDAPMREIFEVNFWGTMHTLRPALREMLSERERSGPLPHVLICSSCVSKVGIPYLSSYSATKAAQDHIGRAMRIELRGRVNVSTIHPIGTDTEFSQGVTDRAQGEPRLARAPTRFRQSPVRVAAAIVACLRSPKPEVWTSTSARMVFGLGSMFPRLGDAILRRKFPPVFAGGT
jgi:short-subunit dehydrogenase